MAFIYYFTLFTIAACSGFISLALLPSAVVILTIHASIRSKRVLNRKHKLLYIATYQFFDKLGYKALQKRIIKFHLWDCLDIIGVYRILASKKLYVLIKEPEETTFPPCYFFFNDSESVSYINVNNMIHTYQFTYSTSNASMLLLGPGGWQELNDEVEIYNLTELILHKTKYFG